MTIEYKSKYINNQTLKTTIHWKLCCNIIKQKPFILTLNSEPILNLYRLNMAKTRLKCYNFSSNTAKQAWKSLLKALQYYFKIILSFLIVHYI